MWLLGRRFSFHLRASNYQGHVWKEALLPHPQRVPEGRSGLCHFLKVYIYLFACLLQKQFVFIIEDWEDTKSMRIERKNHSFSQPDITAVNTWREGQPLMLVWKGAHVKYTSFKISLHLLPNYKSNTYLLQKRQENHHKKFKSIQQSRPGRGDHYKAISLNLTFKNSKSQKPPRQGQKNSPLPCLHLEAWLICLGFVS